MRSLLHIEPSSLICSVDLLCKSMDWFLCDGRHLRHEKVKGRNSRTEVFYQMFLKISQNSQENTCVRVSFFIKLQELAYFVKKETLIEVFSCEFCKIFRKGFFYGTPPVAASVKKLCWDKFYET